MNTLSIRPLSAELAEIAKLELNEDPATIDEELEAFRSWLSEQPHINARMDNQFLIAFLRVCKFSQERARQKIDKFYAARLGLPAVFQSRDVTPKLQELIRLGLFNPLSTVEEKTGSRIILVKPFGYAYDQFTVYDFYKLCYMVEDLLLLDDDSFIISGQIFILDLKGISFGHVIQYYSPSLIRKVSLLITKAYPIRIKGFHFINAIPLFDVLLKIFSSFLSSKLRKRLFVHNSLEALHKHINKELLPAGPAIDLTDKIMQLREWYIEDDKYKMDQSKRPAKSTKAKSVRSSQNLDID